MSNDPIEEADEAYYQEPTTAPEYIMAAYNAIIALSDVDCTILGKDYEKVRGVVIKKSIRIIAKSIDELYDELFVLNASE